MPHVKKTLRLLEAQRRELLEQLDALNRAIAALGDADVSVAEPIHPRQVKAKRVLSDTHRQAVIVGKRKARHAKEVAKGLAREMPDDTFVPAIGQRAPQQAPRLVKKAVKKQ